MILLLLPCLIAFTQARAYRSSVTMVTGLYDIGRDSIKWGERSRSFDMYLQHFARLIKTDCNLVIFGESGQIGEFVAKHRPEHFNTLFIDFPLCKVKQEWWSKQFLSNLIKRGENGEGGPQLHKMHYQLQMYLPVINEKFYWMEEAASLNPFNSQSFYWYDGGITHGIEAYGTDFLKPEGSRSPYEPYEMWAVSTSFRCPPWEPDHMTTDIDRRMLGRKLQNEEFMMANWMGMRREMVSTLANAYSPFMSVVLSSGATLTEEMLTSMLMVREPLLYTGAHIMYNQPKDLKVMLNVNHTKVPIIEYQVHSRFKVSLPSPATDDDQQDEPINQTQQQPDHQAEVVEQPIKREKAKWWEMLKQGGEAIKGETRSRVFRLFKCLFVLAVLVVCHVFWSQLTRKYYFVAYRPVVSQRGRLDSGGGGSDEELPESPDNEMSKLT